MQDFKLMTVANLSALTASDAPVPGGGSISAMAGAYAASLVCMVAKLTLGKPKYASVQDEMAVIDRQAEALRLRMLDGIQKDSASFDAYMEALKLQGNRGGQSAPSVRHAGRPERRLRRAAGRGQGLARGA